VIPQSHGELDLAIEGQLVTEFNRLLSWDPTVVIVDLRDLSFIDPAGCEH
jgi:anti-anti-sigma regulatory factor